MKQAGWFIGLAAFGMMLTLTATEIVKLDSWNAITTPSFIGTQMLHLGSVIAAFIGGKLIPTDNAPKVGE